MDCQCSASIVSPPLFLAQQMPKQPKEQLCFSFTFLKPETPLTYISVASIVLPYNNIKTPLRVYVGYQTEALEMFKLQFVTSNSKQWRSSGNIIFYPMFQIFAQDLLQILEQFSPDIYTWRTISNINFAHHRICAVLLTYYIASECSKKETIGSFNRNVTSGRLPINLI